MDSIKDIFKIGVGPSSSHTMGPRRAAEEFLARFPHAARFRVSLYGSLAATGRGHLTDKAILDVLGRDRAEIDWQPTVFLPFHPNGMRFHALAADGAPLGDWEVYSIGGGFLSEGPGKVQVTAVPYPYTTMAGILGWYAETGKILWEYVLEYEGQPVFDHMREVWRVMREAVERGLEAEGVLPGGLGLQRKASAYHRRALGMREGLRGRGLLYAYALAVAEENAAGSGLIVTAPTCGSAGVLPACLYYLYKHHDLTEKRIIRALATAGLIGAIVKANASISGAEVGCQGEIGVACAMAAAAVNQIFGPRAPWTRTCTPPSPTASTTSPSTRSSAPCSRPATTSPASTRRPQRAASPVSEAPSTQKVRPASRVGGLFHFMEGRTMPRRMTRWQSRKTSAVGMETRTKPAIVTHGLPA